MNQSRRKMDQADEDYLETVTDAFEQCCRAVIVRLDDDSSFDGSTRSRSSGSSPSW